MAMHKVVWPAFMPESCYSNYEYENRPNWERSIYGRLALVGSTVGFGSVVYFPHHIMNYNIIYLFPFMTILLLVGIPLFTLEVALGQYLNIGPIKGFRSLAPILTGVGWGMVTTSLIISIYYNLYLAYSVILFVRHVGHFFGIFQKEDTITICKLTFPKNQPSSISWEISCEILMIFMICWLIVAICLSRGYQSSNKMILFINVLPFYLLLILVILKAYNNDSDGPALSPSLDDFWKHILNWSIWIDAFKQVLFTLGVGFGVNSTLASYNKATKHKFLLDVIAVPLIDFATSLLSLYLIYENLHPEDNSVLFTLCTFAKMMKEDQANVFIYLIFFLMGLSCQLSMVETVVIAILDQYKRLRNYQLYVVFLLCFILALSGSYMCFNKLLFDALFVTGESLLMIFSLLLAMSGPMFCLRIHKIKEDLNLKINRIFETYLKISWSFFCPIILTIGTIVNFSLRNESNLNKSFNIVVIVISVFSVLFSLSFTICKIWKLKFKDYFQPTQDFCLFEKRSHSARARSVHNEILQVDVPP